MSARVLDVRIYLWLLVAKAPGIEAQQPKNELPESTLAEAEIRRLIARRRAVPAGLLALGRYDPGHLVLADAAPMAVGLGGTNGWRVRHCVALLPVGN